MKRRKQKCREKRETARCVVGEKIGTHTSAIWPHPSSIIPKLFHASESSRRIVFAFSILPREAQPLCLMLFDDKLIEVTTTLIERVLLNIIAPSSPSCRSSSSSDLK